MAGNPVRIGPEQAEIMRQTVHMARSQPRGSEARTALLDQLAATVYVLLGPPELDMPAEPEHRAFVQATPAMSATNHNPG